MIEYGSIHNRFTATGKHSGYEIEIYHKGLDEYKNLFGKTTEILDGKIHNQKVSWEKKYATQLERVRKERENKSKAEKAISATQKTNVAKQEIADIESLLMDGIKNVHGFTWSSLKNNEPFCGQSDQNQHIKYRKSDLYPKSIRKQVLPKKPIAAQFKIKISFFDKLFGKKKRILLEQRKKHEKAIFEWEIKCERIQIDNMNKEDDLSIAQAKWAKEERAYNRKRTLKNEAIYQLKQDYENNVAAAIEEYFDLNLKQSIYPATFPNIIDLQYKDESKMLLIDYQLPKLGDIPNLNAIQYIKTKDEFQKKNISEAVRTKLFDSAVYQIALRTIYEVFYADTSDKLEIVNLNGIVSDINSATGHMISSCIISIQAKKEEFLAINLECIDPKQCFRSLKGVGSSKLTAMAAVKPILLLDKSDKRITDHYEVTEGLDDSFNLAAMNWEDFEHLIRELFEQEFAQNGTEVSVTQASSDGGVDAIAFDPDPIRGGKIVIQAKRYTNTVGVSAIRDLYGTVMNEGAILGIIVTTSHYGPDSYEFAKGKPLNLLDGGNLLSMLEKHGHKAKIDIKEAKAILKDQDV